MSSENKVYKSVRVKDNYEGTVPVEVFKRWQELRRKKDSEKLMALLKCSRPLVDRMLNLGNASVESATIITNFFNQREKAENEARENLLDSVKKGGENE